MYEDVMHHTHLHIQGLPELDEGSFGGGIGREAWDAQQPPLPIN